MTSLGQRFVRYIPLWCHCANNYYDKLRIRNCVRCGKTTVCCEYCRIHIFRIGTERKIYVTHYTFLRGEVYRALIL